jgi:hypothetical protein
MPLSDRRHVLQFDEEQIPYWLHDEKFAIFPMNELDTNLYFSEVNDGVNDVLVSFIDGTNYFEQNSAS